MNEAGIPANNVENYHSKASKSGLCDFNLKFFRVLKISDLSRHLRFRLISLFASRSGGFEINQIGNKTRKREKLSLNCVNTTLLTIVLV